MRTSNNDYRPKRPSLLALAAAVVFATANAPGAMAGDVHDVTEKRARQETRAAIHAVADEASMQRWLQRVPVTHLFPPDFDDTLRSQAPLYIIEMTTSDGCAPCADLWSQLRRIGSRYLWRVRTISDADGKVRSGRLGLPWVGHPVAWVRQMDDSGRVIPIAVGTDHRANLARNIYLAAKMLTGVRPAVAVRAMSKFTGIVGAQYGPQNRY